MRKWFPVLALAAGQFVMVLDGTVMNVSISQLVIDLDTSVANIQLAITAYTLVMAAFMLTGGKLGDLLGRRRAFVVGLLIYGTGSAITAASTNATMLLVGWSLVEGLGAVLVVPAILSLTAANYEGRDRSVAYGILGGVAAAGAAAGPLIGGWMTSNLSWRYVFAGETVLVIILGLTARIITDAPRAERRERLDLVGSALSAVGLGLVVFGILQSSTWGWVSPRRPPTIGGTELTPFGFSPTVAVIAAGAAVLAGFARWERYRLDHDRSVLVRLDILKVPTLRAGLSTLVCQQLTIAGTFFVLPLYLQVVLGLDAFHSGIAILPLSITMFITALGASRLGGRVAPRRLIRIGLAVMVVAELLLLGVIDPELESRPFGLALAVLGIGVGLLASQLGNVILSSVDSTRASEAGGLQGTAQNLGASLGTAFIGAIMLGGLTAAFANGIENSPALTPELRTAIAARAERGLEFVPAETAAAVVERSGLGSDAAAATIESYSAAQLAALKTAFGALSLLVLIGFAATSALPSSPLATGMEPAS